MVFFSVPQKQIVPQLKKKKLFSLQMVIFYVKTNLNYLLVIFWKYFYIIKIDGYYQTQMNDYSITYSFNDFIRWEQVPNLFVCLNKCRSNSKCQLVLYQQSNNCSLLNTNTTVQTLFYSKGSTLYQKIPFNNTSS